MGVIPSGLHTVTEQLALLEARVEELVESLRSAEERISRLEGSASSLPQTSRIDTARPDEAAPAAAAAAAAGEEAGIGVGGALSLVGRSSLVLGGAFLIRAVTEAGTLSRPAGVGLGLVYALSWLFFAWRDGRRGLSSSAAFHGIMGVVIGFPLLWEASTRFGVLSSSAAMIAVGLFAAAAVGVAWNQPSQVIAWAATSVTAATLFSFVASTARLELITGVMLLLATATIWLAYARRWHGPRWLAAMAANAAVAVLIFYAPHKGALRDAYQDMSIAGAIALALALPLLSVSSFAVRTLLRKRDVTPFEVLQSAVALLLGFGGAVHIAKFAGLDVTALGMTSLAVGLACYGVAFGFLERDPGTRRNFHFYSSLALLVTLAGSAFWMTQRPLVALWCALGIAGSFLGGRYGRMTLRYHSAIYAVAAAAASGLLTAASDAFGSPAASEWHTVERLAMLALAGTLGSYLALVVARSKDAPKWQRRIPAVVLASIALVGMGASLIDLAAGFASAPFHGRAPEVAALRTAVVAASALLLAAAGRRVQLRELSWFVYPLLAVGGIKLLAEDLPRGTPATLFLGFVCYGCALIVAPKLLWKAARN